MPPYCSARSRNPSSLDIAIAVPPCNYPVWQKLTTIQQLGAIRWQELPSDCRCLSDRFVRSVRESPRLTEWRSLLTKWLQSTVCGELDLLASGRNNAVGQSDQRFKSRATTVREVGAVKGVKHDDRSSTESTRWKDIDRRRE